MGKKKSKYITPDNIGAWCSALGFSFPRTEKEEKIADYFYKDFDYKLSPEDIDPIKLFQECENEKKTRQLQKTSENWKLAARNFGNIPDHILDKMKKNQDDKTENSSEN